VVAKEKILQGEVLTQKNICLKRPGNGFFKTKDFYRLLGKKASKDIRSNVQLKKKDIK